MVLGQGHMVMARAKIMPKVITMADTDTNLVQVLLSAKRLQLLHHTQRLVPPPTTSKNEMQGVGRRYKEEVQNKWREEILKTATNTEHTANTCVVETSELLATPPQRLPRRVLMVWFGVVSLLPLSMPK